MGQSPLQRFDFSRPEMGTVFRISMYAASETKASKASEAAFAKVAALNQTCSDYLSESEITRLSRIGDLVVSDDLFEVIQRSQRVADLTHGAFDITVGHFTNLWRRSKRKGVLPTDEQLTNAQSLTDWRAVLLDSKTKRITLKKSPMQLDLGGIAKGYAADAALKVLKEQGIPSAVVAASGDLAIGTAPPNEPGWEVRIRTFEAPEATDKLITLRLHDCGISTSGDLHQSVVIDGKRYSHIVDPRTGLGLTNRIACSVIAPDATTSDAFATALCVLGVESGLAVLKTQSLINARFAEFGHDDAVRVTTTPAFPAPK